MQDPRIKSSLSRLTLGAFMAISLFVCPFTAKAVKVNSANFDTGTFKILTDSAGFNVEVEGTVVDAAADTPYNYAVYVTGRDIYGNTVYIQDGLVGDVVGTVTVRGEYSSLPPGATTPVIVPATKARIQGRWFIPNDGTLYNVGDGGYNIVVVLFPAGTPIPNVATLTSTASATARSGQISIDVVPNISATRNPPSVTYTAGQYRGGDIVQFNSAWRNSRRGEGGLRQSRPLRPSSADLYAIEVRLSTDAEFGGAKNDDFQILNSLITGDAPYGVDGSTDLRRVTVSSTPPAVPAYGVRVATSGGAVVAGTARNYTPQPDDGFLDIDEVVQLTTEELMPSNYAGQYFVAFSVQMVNPDFDTAVAEGDEDFVNTFVSQSTSKIELLETSAPTVEAVSSVSTQDGVYVQGGNGASDFGSISEDGNYIALVSRASNLLNSPAGGSASVTSGQQVFLRTRATREMFLASKSSSSGLAANADCFNPTISADGRYVAFDSAASNLANADTGGRSMIYVHTREGGGMALVSRNRDGAPANGSCFNPAMSQSGRFVVFESIATNLDLPQFSAVLSGGRVSSPLTRLRGGAGYSGAAPPRVTIAPPPAGGTQATAVATVGANGAITAITVTNQGSGYATPPTVTVDPPPPLVVGGTTMSQVYLHDRDTDADGIFDETGAIATYLVSLTGSGQRANNLCYAPVINLEDSPAELEANGGMYVAFASYAGNLPNQTPSLSAMVYRVRVNVTNATLSTRGPVLGSVEAVSLNDLGTSGGEPFATGTDPSGAWIVPYCIEPSINGDGSQIAFTSAAINFVYNPATGAFDGDSNRVPDIFVRDFSVTPPLTKRVSVSRPKVATGTITFVSPVWSPALGTPVGNIPVNQPAAGDAIEISDGNGALRVFRFYNALPFIPAPGPGEVGVLIGGTIQATRDALVAAINTQTGFAIFAAPTSPPAGGAGSSFRASIYLRNTIPGEAGNVPILVNGVAIGLLGGGGNGTIAGSGMAGGGIQSEDAAAAVQGVSLGSDEPSIDRSGRFVAFRSISGNLDVHIATDANRYPTSPVTGELIRPILTGQGNVYLHDRLLDADPARPFDDTDNVSTKRVSLDRFGYPTRVFGLTGTGVGARTTASSSTPAISADGRFVVFSSDSEGVGGLIFGLNNLSPLDNTKFRDVFVSDALSVGTNPPVPTTRPEVALLSPADGLIVAPNTDLTITASARPAPGKTIASVELFVGDATSQTSQGSLQAEPFSWTYRLRSTGQYVIRVVATDSKGLQSEAAVTVTAENPPEGAPFVQMTQPTAAVNFVTGSTLFLNATATAGPGRTIKKESVKLSVNGVDSTDAMGTLGNSFGVLYRPTVPFIVDTYRASATDSANVSSLSGPLFSFLTLALSPLPTVKILPFTTADQINAGQVVQLSAEAFFPQTGSNARIPARVEFYVNKVYVGDGIAGQALPSGRTVYTLPWEVSQEFVDATSPTGTQIFEVYARAVALNWQSNTENDNVIEFYGSVVDGPTPLTVFYVPSNPPAGSNAAFIIDTFQKLFFRAPTYNEYSEYLAQLDSGSSQSQIVVEMADTDKFEQNQQVLFGYYIRMGLAPSSKAASNDTTSVANLLALMTNGTNVTLLPATMSAGVSGVPNLGASPYGATVGQALVAERLINSVNTVWTNGVLPRNFPANDGSPFLNWMRRTFNEPYLPVTNTNVILSMGNANDQLVTLSNFPTPVSAKLRRYGYSYAFTSALYDSMPLASVSTNNGLGLRTALSNFPALVKGVAVSYLLSPTSQWPTNSSGAINTNTVLSTNLVSNYLPPQITSSNAVTGRVGTNSLYQITAINTNGTTVYSASNLPPGITNVNAATGAVFGIPTTEGSFKTTVFATRQNAFTNGGNATTNTLVGSNEVTFTIVAQAPRITSSTNASGTNNEPFDSYMIIVAPTNSATKFGMTTNLPPGLFFNATNGSVFGTPTITTTFSNALFFTNTLFATNSGGSTSTNFIISIEPALSASGKYFKNAGLSGPNARLDADPDGDGFINAGEFAFGMQPNAKDQSPAKSVASGTNLKLFFSRRTNSSDVIYFTESATSLNNPVWSTVNVSSQPDSDGVIAPPGYQRVSITVTPPPSGAMFYRVRAQVR